MRIRAQHDFQAGVRAFTLIELLLAVSIFAVVMAAINTVLFSAMHLHKSASAAVEVMRAPDRAITILRRDLANTVPPGGLMAPWFISGVVPANIPTNGLSGQGNGQWGLGSSGVGNLGTLGNQNVLMEFYSNVGQPNDDLPWGDIVKVDYMLQPTVDPNYANSQDLVRVVMHNPLAAVSETPDQLTILSGVQNVVFSFFDGTNYFNTWDSTIASNAPMLVKVEIDRSPELNSRRQPTPIIFSVPIDAEVPPTNALIEATSTNNATGG